MAGEHQIVFVSGYFLSTCRQGKVRNDNPLRSTATNQLRLYESSFGGLADLHMSSARDGHVHGMLLLSKSLVYDGVNPPRLWVAKTWRGGVHGYQDS